MILSLYVQFEVFLNLYLLSPDIYFKIEQLNYKKKHSKSNSKFLWMILKYNKLLIIFKILLSKLSLNINWK